MGSPSHSMAQPNPTTISTPAVYSGSADSTPLSRHNDSWDANPPPNQLRLMCSYGGHIVPRPHDKTLCYVGGDTRIIFVNRQTSLSDLHRRLSENLLRNGPFSLKYQLPGEDLDSLISVNTDEDLENMVEEYDRLNNAGGGLKHGRIRLFLFPKSSSGIEQLLVETASTKLEDWFFNALNGKANLSAAAGDHGLSESSSVNCLLGLDDESVGKAAVVEKEVETQMEGARVGFDGNGNTSGNYVIYQGLHSATNSPKIRTTSSFEYTPSSPSVAKLPPVGMHVEENPKAEGLRIEEQFQQMTVGVGGNVNLPLPQKQEEVGGSVVAGTVVSVSPVVVSGEHANRVVSNDERSDHGGYRKVQQSQPQVQAQLQQQHIPQFQQKQTSDFDLPSPGSVSSEGSVANPLSRQRQASYEEKLAQVQSGNTWILSNKDEQKNGDQNNSKIQMQPQAQESAYVLPSQNDENQPQLRQQQQFAHAPNQYIPAGAVPIASYYPLYPLHQQHNPHLPMLNRHYPVYFPRPDQPYKFPVHQPSELVPNVPSSHPQTPPTAIAPHAAYDQARNIPPCKPEMIGGINRRAATEVDPQLAQVPSGQHQAPYVGFTQIPHPSQSMNPFAVANSTYEFAEPANAQMYHVPLPPQKVAQYQNLTSAPVMVIPDASAQLTTQNIRHQVRTSQP